MTKKLNQFSTDLTLEAQNGKLDPVIGREEETERLIEEELSPFEKKVLDLMLTGMDYTNIAAVLGRDVKSTDNAIQRAKGKLKKAWKTN